MHVEVLQTLADPSRFRIVELLRGGERSVNDIVEKVDIDQSGVSRHLRILEKSGFVQLRPEGSKRIYSLRPDRFREIDTWLDSYRALWEKRLDRFAAELERRKKKRGV
jgi:DNA-binding transcriptional ArsR family regulator